MNIISILNVKQLNSLLIVSFLLLISSCKDTNKVDCQIGDSAKNISFSDYVDSIKTVYFCEDSIVLGDAKKNSKGTEMLLCAKSAKRRNYQV